MSAYHQDQEIMAEKEVLTRHSCLIPRLCKATVICLEPSMDGMKYWVVFLDGSSAKLHAENMKPVKN